MKEHKTLAGSIKTSFEFALKSGPSDLHLGRLCSSFSSSQKVGNREKKPPDKRRDLRKDASHFGLVDKVK
ncbi:hypothetical protein TYRP_019019 [Tyrophagus putrescentiae]|nr:hypothetical protein TYRP_019019 [Tyrophagus putrescentiae]